MGSKSEWEGPAVVLTGNTLQNKARKEQPEPTWRAGLWYRQNLCLLHQKIKDFSDDFQPPVKQFSSA